MTVSGHKLIGALLAICLLAGCEDTTFQSSVPAYTVHVVIDTRIGDFVHFQPSSLGSHIIVDETGYYYDGKFLKARDVTDYYGYAGVIVYVPVIPPATGEPYCAHDLACPDCAKKQLRRQCQIEGMRAVCPECHEQYDLSFGIGNPLQGISKEAMRPLQVRNQGGKLTITQKR